jgi:hypothetical protein
MHGNNFNQGTGLAFGVIPNVPVVNNVELSEHYCAVL